MSNIREFFHSTIGDQAEDSTGPVVDVTTVRLVEMPVTSFFGEAHAVAGGSTVAIVTVTVPTGETYYFQKASFSGENKGVYDLVIDGTTRDRKRTWWCDFNGEFDFVGLPGYGLKLLEGSVIQVMVKNDGPVGNFEARVQVIAVVNAV